MYLVLQRDWVKFSETILLRDSWFVGTISLTLWFVLSIQFFQRVENENKLAVLVWDLLFWGCPLSWIGYGEIWFLCNTVGYIWCHNSLDMPDSYLFQCNSSHIQRPENENKFAVQGSELEGSSRRGYVYLTNLTFPIKIFLTSVEYVIQ